MARVRSVSSYQSSALDTGWELAAVTAGAAHAPDYFARAAVEWLRAAVPGTSAAALREAGRWNFSTAQNFDDADWWYRCRFAAPPTIPGVRSYLRLEGLATIADVWCNGVHILRSENMYVASAVEVTALLRAENELYIVFHSLTQLLQARRPRPRWRTRLVEQQQLRWLRTTLLGRMPGWCPPVAPVGPWRPIRLEQQRAISAVNAQLFVDADTRSVRTALQLQGMDGQRIRGAELIVGGVRAQLQSQENGAGMFHAHGNLRLPEAEPWWPHTHGTQPLYEATLLVHLDGEAVRIHCGQLGFRKLALHTGAGDDFALHINDAPIFCRGACWTPPDVVTLAATPTAYREALEQVRAAGMNMLRLPGNTIYEAPEFYDLCDQLGILVWQDFMFANLDYPSSDPRFAASVENEARQLVDGLQQSPALTVLCGGSEVEQQAAMLGLSRESWTNTLFRVALPAVCTALRPDVPYWPSSPSGGELPFQVNSGVAHYYGVGAYLRPLEDARRCEVRFAAECLAFANIPEDSTLESCFTSATAVSHHPQWKARVPRDVGAGWDFEDVRDFYLRLLFTVDPQALRYSDPQRYLMLSRVVPGEIMTRTFAEWRRGRSSCHGALVWLLRDPWPGAGWGQIDALGIPKASYYYLKRACKPLCVFITDEGCNGLYLHVVNELPQQQDVTIRVALYRHGEARIADGQTLIDMRPRDHVEIPMSRLFPAFLDTSYAYRFGPPSHDLVVATLLDRASGAMNDTAFFFPAGFPAVVPSDLGLTATGRRDAAGNYTFVVRTQQFAQSVTISAADFLPSDNYFHLEPGGQRTIVLHPKKSATRLQATLTALNTLATPLQLASVVLPASGNSLSPEISS